MLYLINGEEALLVEEAIENTFATLKSKGYAQKKVFEIENDAQLEAALQESKSPSLFDEGKTVYFLKMNKKNKKLKKLPEGAKLIEIPPLTLTQFPMWIEKRFQKAGFILNANVRQLLCEHFEGNILAAHQCLQKCILMYPKGELSEEQIMAVLSPAARYNIFDLINHLQPTRAGKIPKILSRLQEEGVEPAIILWGLARECRRKKMEKALPLLSKTDEIIKGIQPGKCWETLLESAFMLAERPLF